MWKRHFSLYAVISIFSWKWWVSNYRKIHVAVFSTPRHWLDWAYPFEPGPSWESWIRIRLFFLFNVWCPGTGNPSSFCAVFSKQQRLDPPDLDTNFLNGTSYQNVGYELLTGRIASSLLSVLFKTENSRIQINKRPLSFSISLNSQTQTHLIHNIYELVTHWTKSFVWFTLLKALA